VLQRSGLRVEAANRDCELLQRRAAKEATRAKGQKNGKRSKLVDAKYPSNC